MLNLTNLVNLLFIRYYICYSKHSIGFDKCENLRTKDLPQTCNRLGNFLNPNLNNDIDRFDCIAALHPIYPISYRNPKRSLIVITIVKTFGGA